MKQMADCTIDNTSRRRDSNSISSIDRKQNKSSKALFAISPKKEKVKSKDKTDEDLEDEKRKKFIRSHTRRLTNIIIKSDEKKKDIKKLNLTKIIEQGKPERGEAYHEAMEIDPEIVKRLKRQTTFNC